MRIEIKSKINFLQNINKKNSQFEYILIIFLKFKKRENRQCETGTYITYC